MILHMGAWPFFFNEFFSRSEKREGAPSARGRGDPNQITVFLPMTMG